MKFVASLCLMVALVASSRPAFAQAAAAGSASTSGSPIEIRNASSVILISGLAGAILGLSTLSFYEEPQDHISNITIGAGIGVIAAAILLTAEVTQNPPGGKKADLEPGFRWSPGLDDEGRLQVAGHWRF